MGGFGALAFLVGGGLLVAAFIRQKVVGTEAFQRAMMLFFAALIVHDVAGGIPFVGMVAVPIGYGLALWSFRDLCSVVAARTSSSQRGDAEEF